MEKILNTTINGYGERVPTAVLSQEGGVLRLWEVECYSSRDFGLGNCYCVNHPGASESPVSTDEVIRRFGIEALEGFEKDYRQIIFDAFGIEVDELETFLRVSYMFGENPLPTLRKITDHGVVFAESTEGLVFPEEESGSIVFVVNSRGEISVIEI